MPGPCVEDVMQQINKELKHQARRWKRGEISLSDYRQQRDVLVRCAIERFSESDDMTRPLLKSDSSSNV